MKTALLIILFAIGKISFSQEFSFPKNEIDSLNKLKVSINFKPTKYKPGFVYYDNNGFPTTLLSWVKAGSLYGVDTYRWRIKINLMGGVETLAYTDDCWIDVRTGKAYIDKDYQIKYY